MNTTFETLYHLAIELQTRPDLASLTAHHNTDRHTVELQLRRSILQLVMLNESIDSPWQKVRIFCLNLVNRAQAVITADQMRELLTRVESMTDVDAQRVLSLPQVAMQSLSGRRASELIDALRLVTAADSVAALGQQSYLDWIDQRWLYWVNKRVDEIDADEILKDIHVLATDKQTKMPGMGIPLAANLFADLGLPAFVKPDLHVQPVANWLTFKDGEEAAIRGLVKIAQIESRALSRHPAFDWLQLHGGLRPRDLSRLIYMVVSDNCKLDGNQNRRQAPRRIELIRAALIDAGIIQSRYQ